VRCTWHALTIFATIMISLFVCGHYCGSVAGEGDIRPNVDARCIRKEGDETGEV
jgi:hypothetical protein